MARSSKYVMSSAEWVALAQKKRAPSAPIARDVAVETEPTEEGGAITLSSVTMSDDSEDRGRDTIALDGWRLENFTANPVLLWCHDYSEPPIGTVKGAAVAGGRLVAESIIFATQEQNPFGAMIGGMYQAGLCRGFSIGMLPLKWAWNEERGGVDFLEQELLELSGCPVPMNASCLAGAKSMGLQVSLLVERAQRFLDGDSRAPSWMTGDEAIAIWRTLRAPTVQVPKSFPRAAAPRPAPPPAPRPADVQRAVAGAVVEELKKQLFSITGVLPD